MGGADEFARAVVKKSVAKVCVELGYSSIHESALHVMMDLLTRFLHKFGVLMRINAEDYCSRSYNEIDDALYALEQMGISIDEIFSCVREFNPGALDEDIPLFPVPLENMSNQSNQPTFNPSLDGEPPISLISQLSVLEKGENKAEEKENKSLTPVKTVETSSDEPSSNKVETPPPKQSQPTFLHINPSLASSSSGMLPTSVTLQYDEDRAVSENQMGTPKKVALLKQNLLKKPNEHLEPMSETFTGACSRKLRLGNDAGVNSPMKDDGTEKSPVIKEKQGAETEDQGSVTCKTGSSQSSSETDKQTPKKQQKENTCDVVDAAPLVKTLPIPPANAKAASAIDHETETEKVVEHRGMVIRTIKKDNALPVLQFPSLPKTNKDTKRKTSAKRKESETSSVKFQINLGNKIAGRKRNRSGATKPSLSKNVSSGQETVDSLVAGGSAMKSEPELEDASNASMLNTDSDNDNTELNSSREMEPSEDSSAETPSTYAAQESVSQPEPIKADLLNVGSSLKQEYDDESPPNKVNEAIVAEESLEESAEGQCEAIDMSVWTPKEVSKSVDTASAMFDDALASPPEGQTRIFGNIQTPITIPETPDILTTPMCSGMNSSTSVFANIFNSSPRFKTEPTDYSEGFSEPPAVIAAASDEIERPDTPLSAEDDGGDETDAESDANKIFSPCLEGNSSPRANSDCLDALTSDNAVIGHPGDSYPPGLRDRPSIVPEVNDDEDIEVPPSPDLPPPTPSTSNEIPRSPILDDDLNSGPNSVDRSSPTSAAHPPILLYQRQSVIVSNPATTSPTSTTIHVCASPPPIPPSTSTAFHSTLDHVSSTTLPSLLLPHSGMGSLAGGPQLKQEAPDSPLISPPSGLMGSENIPLQNPEVSCASEEGFFSQQHTATSILKHAETATSRNSSSHKSSKDKDRSSGHGRKRKHSSEHKSKKKHKKMKREYVELEESSRASFNQDEESSVGLGVPEEGVFHDMPLEEEEDEDDVDSHMPMLKLTLKFGGKSVTIGPEDSNKNDTEKPLHVKTDGLYSTPPSPSADTSASVDTEEENKKATVATVSASKRAKEGSMKSLLQKAELMQTDFSAAAAVVKSSANQSQSSTADLMSPITPVGIREIDFANTSPNLPPLVGTAPSYDSYGSQGLASAVQSTSSAMESVTAFTYDSSSAAVTSDPLQEWICPACSLPDNGTSPMIGCDRCDAWYHWQCLGIVTEPSSEQWYCPNCVLQSHKSSSSKGTGGSSNGGKKKSKKMSSGSSKRK